jgi:hypothetical protein
MVIQPKKQKAVTMRGSLQKHDSLGSIDSIFKRKKNSLTNQRSNRLTRSASVDSYLSAWENTQLSKKQYLKKPNSLTGDTIRTKNIKEDSLLNSRKRSISSGSILIPEDILNLNPSPSPLVEKNPRSPRFESTIGKPELNSPEPNSKKPELVEEISVHTDFSSYLSPFKQDMSLQIDYSEEEGIIYKENKEGMSKKVAAGMLDKLISQLADGKMAGLCFFLKKPYLFIYFCNKSRW